MSDHIHDWHIVLPEEDEYLPHLICECGAASQPSPAQLGIVDDADDTPLPYDDESEGAYRPSI